VVWISTGSSTRDQSKIISETRQKKELTAPVTVLLLYFLSGAAALVYEVAWSRMLMHVFGSTAVALGTVLAAFMAGMAVGSWLIGKTADKSKNCLRLYAFLEFGLALGALVSHILLSNIGPVHLALHEIFGFSEAVFGVVRFLLAFLLVMAPTVLMGATLPVLARYLVNRRNKVGINLSTLYATNTFGAVTGVLLTGFYLIGTYGVHVAVYIAVVANILIACIALLASRRIGDTPLDDPVPSLTTGSSQPRSEAAVDPLVFRVILVGLGISGFTSFAYEIYWTRSLVFILGNSTYALTMMLSAFLSGIAIGGYLVRFALRYMVDRVVTFGFIQVLLGIVSALALPLLFFISDPQSLNQYVLDTSGQVFRLIFTSFGVAFLLMLVPAILIGSTFPLAGQILVKDLHKTGSSVGSLYAINTLGNVLGALLPGFILLSLLGIQKGILLMAALNVLLGFVVLVLALKRSKRHPAWGYALPVALVLTILAMSRAPLQFQFPSEGEQDFFRTIFYREGPLATTKVYVNPRSTEKHMSVDGIVIGGTGYVEFKQLLLAHLPKMLVDDVSNELSVGLGSGMLAGESARHDGVESITAVEIEPGVVEGAARFAKENHAVLDNSRVRVEVDDVGNFLRTTADLYQVISADEKTADSFASNGFSYSLEYYDLLRNHLAPGGIAAQWVPATLPTRQFRMILKTFAESFPHVQLWYFLPAYKKGPFNTILIGSNERIMLDYDHMQREFTDHPEALSSLVPYGLTSANAVLSQYVADERSLRPAVSDALINSFDHPRYEFFYPWDYTIGKQEQIIANHKFIRELKRRARADFVADLAIGEQDMSRLQQTLAAEDAYLQGFEQFQTGISLTDQYRLFDAILAMAPWNDSLRARIYSQYSHIASNRRDASERLRLMRRANQLYEGRAGRQR
jgi:spermidine synthase